MGRDNDVSFSNDCSNIPVTAISTPIGGEIYEICNLTIFILSESITPTPDTDVIDRA